jgi:protein ImuB
MFACLHVPDFSVQAALLREPPDTRQTLRQAPVAILDGPENLPKVVALNDAARKARIGTGMTKLQVETCSGTVLRKRSEENEAFAQAVLIECANGFSPRVESSCPGTAILDLDGTEKLFGASDAVARKISANAGERDLYLHIGVASNPDTAFYMARGFAGITIIPVGLEASKLAQLNVDLLPITPDMLETLYAWGIRTFGALAALPEAELSQRLGQEGIYLQKLTRARVHRTISPIARADKFIESYEFDDPVETLESLSFVLNRLLQQTCAHLVSHAFATNEVRLTLDLDVRQRRERNNGEQYRHEWKLPVPVQDGKMLLTLMRLDLERNTFDAPIRKITVEAVPVKRRMAQGNLFAPPCPEPENLEITLARMRGIVGCKDSEGTNCVGSPGILDTHKPGSFGVVPFSSATAVTSSASETSFPIALRMFRPPLETVVEMTGASPHIVRLWKRHLRVLAASGPWCSSGNWWNATQWAREEWDVALKTATGVGFYRICRDYIRKQWFVEAIFD